jgi:hypothetical protein
MDETLNNFVKLAYEQVPPDMQPTDLKGRFNIPPAAKPVGDDQAEAAGAPEEPADGGTDDQGGADTQEVSYVVVARPKSKYRIRFYVQGRK